MKKEHIVKAHHKSRNILAHEISRYTESSNEAVALLGDCITILKIMGKFKSNK